MEEQFLCGERGRPGIWEQGCVLLARPMLSCNQAGIAHGAKRVGVAVTKATPSGRLAG